MSLSQLRTSESFRIALRASPAPVHPAVVMQSMWKDDAKRWLTIRGNMLLNKSYPNLRWVWLVGDCTDSTAEALRRGLETRWRDKADRVTVIELQTSVTGNSRAQRLRRMSATTNVGLDSLRPTDEYLLFHESDLASPVDLVERFLATGKCPVAGWVTLQVNPVENVFYDTWGYRQNGKLFVDKPPYCDNYDATQPFEVDSVGSVWMTHAEDFRDGIRVHDEACVERCKHLRARGRTIWVDPSIPIVQPKGLWVPRDSSL